MRNPVVAEAYVEINRQFGREKATVTETADKFSTKIRQVDGSMENR